MLEEVETAGLRCGGPTWIEGTTENSRRGARVARGRTAIGRKGLRSHGADRCRTRARPPRKLNKRCARGTRGGGVQGGQTPAGQAVRARKGPDPKAPPRTMLRRARSTTPKEPTREGERDRAPRQPEGQSARGTRPMSPRTTRQRRPESSRPEGKLGRQCLKTHGSPKALFPRRSPRVQTPKVRRSQGSEGPKGSQRVPKGPKVEGPKASESRRSSGMNRGERMFRKGTGRVCEFSFQ